MGVDVEVHRELDLARRALREVVAQLAQRLAPGGPDVRIAGRLDHRRWSGLAVLPLAGQQGIPGLGFANNGIDLTAQANLESNRDGTRYVRLSVAPVFQTVPRMAGFTAQPVVVPGIGGQ